MADIPAICSTISQRLSHDWEVQWRTRSNGPWNSNSSLMYREKAQAASALFSELSSKASSDLRNAIAVGAIDSEANVELCVQEILSPVASLARRAIEGMRDEYARGGGANQAIVAGSIEPSIQAVGRELEISSKELKHQLEVEIDRVRKKQKREKEDEDERRTKKSREAWRFRIEMVSKVCSGAAVVAAAVSAISNSLSAWIAAAGTAVFALIVWYLQRLLYPRDP